MLVILALIRSLVAAEPPSVGAGDQTGDPPLVAAPEIPSYQVKTKGLSSELSGMLSVLPVDVERAYSALPRCFDRVAPIEMDVVAGPNGEVWINVRLPYRDGYFRTSELMGMRAFSTACVSALAMPAVMWAYKVVQRKDASPPVRSVFLAADVTVTFINTKRDQLVFPVVWDAHGSYAGPAITLVSSKGVVKQVLSTNASSWRPGRTTFVMYPQGTVDVRGLTLDSEEVYRFLGTSGDASASPPADH